MEQPKQLGHSFHFPLLPLLSLPPQLDALIGHLSLEPLSLEGGWFKALYRAASASAILYAVRVGEPCRLHRIPQRETYTALAGNFPSGQKK